jgi:hypothetical protein
MAADGEEYRVRETFGTDAPPPNRSLANGSNVEVASLGWPTIEVTLHSDWRTLTDNELLRERRSAGAANGFAGDDESPAP